MSEAALAPVESASPPPRSPAPRVWRRLLASTQARAGAVCLLVVLVLGFGAPLIELITGQDPQTFDSTAIDPNTGGVPIGPFGGASSTHWLGVEPATGRDLLALISYGTRTSVVIAAGATALSAAIGVLLGLAMGYFGGWFDNVMGRVVDFMFGFPSLLFLIAIQLVVPPEFPRGLLIMVSLAFFSWAGTARLVAGQARALAARDYITAARASGTRPFTVLVRELLPNVMGMVVVIVALQFPGTVGAAAGLSFLGIGVGPQTPELGRLIGLSITWTYTGADPWYLIFPGTALFLLVIGSTLVGDALRDAFDVKLEGRT